MKNYKIAVAGTGYVGLSLGVLFAQHHQVVAVDIVQAKVDMINNKKSPIQDSHKAFFIFNIHLNSSVFVSSRIGSDESSTALSSNLWFGLVTWKRVVYLLGGRD